LLHLFICYLYQFTVLLFTWQRAYRPFGHPCVALKETNSQSLP
jgi:hypothetical protein